jgi:hypothetical protein
MFPLPVDNYRARRHYGWASRTIERIDAEGCVILLQYRAGLDITSPRSSENAKKSGAIRTALNAW